MASPCGIRWNRRGTQDLIEQLEREFLPEAKESHTTDYREVAGFTCRDAEATGMLI